jgi:hypothetical protein
MRREVWTQTHTEGEYAVKMKAEMANAFLCQELPEIAANSQILGERHAMDSCSQPSEGTNPTNTLTSDFQLPVL